MLITRAPYPERAGTSGGGPPSDSPPPSFIRPSPPPSSDSPPPPPSSWLSPSASQTGTARSTATHGVSRDGTLLPRLCAASPAKLKRAPTLRLLTSNNNITKKKKKKKNKWKWVNMEMVGPLVVMIASGRGAQITARGAICGPSSIFQWPATWQKKKTKNLTWAESLVKGEGGQRRGRKVEPFSIFEDTNKWWQEHHLSGVNTDHCVLEAKIVSPTLCWFMKTSHEWCLKNGRLITLPWVRIVEIPLLSSAELHRLGDWGPLATPKSSTIFLDTFHRKMMKWTMNETIQKVEESKSGPFIRPFFFLSGPPTKTLAHRCLMNDWLVHAAQIKVNKKMTPDAFQSLLPDVWKDLFICFFIFTS